MLRLSRPELQRIFVVRSEEWWETQPESVSAATISDAKEIGRALGSEDIGIT
jgi:hypothetical protein